MKVEALLQLAAYADTLARRGVPVAPRSSWCSATARSPSYRVDELLPVYLPRRAALQRLLDDHLAGGAPVSLGRRRTSAPASAARSATSRSARATTCCWSPGMRVSQRARLIDAGVTTVHELAAHDGPVPELSARTRRRR